MLTQGLHARLAVMVVVRPPRGEYRSEVSGPKRAMTLIGVSDAKWHGPLSLDINRWLRQYSVRSSGSVVYPAKERARGGGPIAAAIFSAPSFSFGAPVITTVASDMTDSIRLPNSMKYFAGH